VSDDSSIATVQHAELIYASVRPKGLDTPGNLKERGASPVTCENAGFVRRILMGFLAIQACHENRPNH